MGPVRIERTTSSASRKRSPTELRTLNKELLKEESDYILGIFFPDGAGDRNRTGTIANVIEGF